LNLKRKIIRLKRLSLPEVAFALTSKVKRVYFERLDREGRKISQPKAAITAPLHGFLLHPDVTTPGFPQSFLDLFPQDAALIIEKANRLCDLEFDILGSGPIQVGEFAKKNKLERIDPSDPAKLIPDSFQGRIPWHFDIKTRKSWPPSVFFADIRYGHRHGMDIKMPWELSRCGHFVSLGQAYRLTYDEKYAREFVLQIQDWMDQNPVKMGVNWASPMDIGLRACNWIAAWEMFKGSNSITAEIADRFDQSLHDHGDHIDKYLEFGGGVPTNHYIANLLALFYIGMALKNRDWARKGAKGLLKEMSRQTYDDGFHYEGATAYHCLVLEMFSVFASVVFKPRFDRPFCGLTSPSRMDSFAHQLKKMFLALDSFLLPNGQIPLIGDNDNGCVHTWLPLPSGSKRHLSNAALFIFPGAPDVVNKEPVNSESVWLFGLISVKTKLKEIPLKRVPKNETHLSSSGLLVLRGDNDVLTFSAQPNGTRGVGNHTHNDKLSFTLFAGGEDFIIDPGSYVYTSHASYRNLFRSTAYHNTIEVDGEEQNRFMGDDLFSLENDARVTRMEPQDTRRVHARHTGYARLQGSVVHERCIERKASPLGWVIKDNVTGKGAHSLRWTFVLAPHVKISPDKSSGLVLLGHFGLITLNSSEGSGPFRIEEGHVSPGYGVRVPTTFVRLEMDTSLPAKKTFYLEWRSRT